MILEIKPRWTPSGLMAMKVRSAFPDMFGGLGLWTSENEGGVGKWWKIVNCKKKMIYGGNW